MSTPGDTYLLRRPPREPRFTLDYENALNPAQLEAVVTHEGPILVVAGAGSGKTRTLVFRVARLVEQGIAPHAILLLTFTRMGLDKKEKRFPRKQTIADMFSMAVNKSRPLRELIDDSYSHLVEHADDLVTLEADYRAYKAARQVVDYDDLLVKLHELLHDHPGVRAQLSRRHGYIMVDEYQDTNPLQAAIVRLLASEHDNVMAVGDDAQSIYAFRGADFRNIMDFPTLFPGTRIIRLEQNYRSTQPILDVANAVVTQSRERYTKTLFTTQPEGVQPLLIAAENENYQSRFVAQRILELREEGVPLPEIAVLFRSSFHSFDLELELARADLPFIKRGGFKLIETAHVKDALAHLRVLENPRDAVSWHRLLLLLEGIGPRAAETIATQLVVSGDVA